MEIRAYNQYYLHDAMTNLAVLLDYAVNYRHHDIDGFWQRFLTAGSLAERFAKGDPATVSGHSGVELYYIITGDPNDDQPEYIEFERSPEYWTGWSLAYCQWHMCRSFAELSHIISLGELVEMYPLYHEMDVLHTVEALQTRLKNIPTNLEILRRRAGHSQAQLARLSTVSIRSIQMYEQRQNDIRKAQYNVLKALAGVLECGVEELV